MPGAICYGPPTTVCIRAEFHSGELLCGVGLKVMWSRGLDWCWCVVPVSCPTHVQTCLGPHACGVSGFHFCPCGLQTIWFLKVTGPLVRYLTRSQASELASPSHWAASTSLDTKTLTQQTGKQTYMAILRPKLLIIGCDPWHDEAIS